MLVLSRGSRWKRDPGLTEIIRHFDQPERYGKVEILTAKELELISGEVDRCQKDFIYAARNYFWITDKNGQDRLFSLWESQELVLEELLRVKAMGQSQKLMILKARQLGASTLIEALVAWRTMFWPNTNAIVVSNRATHAEYLFSIMTHILDHMPWWLKPMVATRTYKDGLLFDNPDPDKRRSEPGLHSLVTVQSATQGSGIGQGYRISACHCSEYSDWPEDVAQETIEGDLEKAIAPGPNSFAILESTAKGAGSYSHKLWRKNVELAERAKWRPIFLPWFFEKTRILPPPNGWVPDKPELIMRETVAGQWLQCDQCFQWHEEFHSGEHRNGLDCPTCGKGILYPYELTDDQLYWMQTERVNAEKDAKSSKTLKQELCTTSEEAFQISGYQIFKQEAQDFVAASVRPPLAVGNLEKQGRFHGVREILKTAHAQPIGSRCWCEGCDIDHRFDPAPLQIWEFPVADAKYCVGVDVAEGLGGEFDYSIAFVNRVGINEPDVHVATYRSNEINPVDFAAPVAFLGLLYNTALMCIEVNRYDTCANEVRFRYMYPNIYRWKHLDSTKPLSEKWHWLTTFSSKPRLWQTADRWLRAGLWIVRSSNFAEEMKTFQKDSWEDRGGRADFGFHDDEVMAGTICLYCSHELEYDEDFGSVRLPGFTGNGLAPGAEFEATCPRCLKVDTCSDPNSYRCPECGYMLISFKRLGVPASQYKSGWKFEDMEKTAMDTEEDAGSMIYRDVSWYDPSHY